MDKQNLIQWARSCHYDMLICVKEIKGKRWVSVLGYIECKGGFSIDDFNIDESWKLIFKTIHTLDDYDLLCISNMRKN